MTSFFRLTAVASDRKAEELRKHVASVNATAGDTVADVFDVDSTELSAIPGAPFAYWLSAALREQIRRAQPFESDELARTAMQGLITGDDERFVRLWWEVEAERIAPSADVWFPFTKGGRRAHLYADVQTVVRYDRVGQAGIVAVGRFGRGATHYFRPGLSWPLRGSRFSAYAVPAGCIFSVGGKMAFARREDLGAILAIFNAGSFDGLVRIRAGKVGGVQYEAGLIQRVPIPVFDLGVRATLSELARQAWVALYRSDTLNETSHAFHAPLGACRAPGPASVVEPALREIDRVVTCAYGFSNEDRLSLEGGLVALGRDDEDESEDSEASSLELDVIEESLAVLSWLVGVAFGRFDQRLATGERHAPLEPEPFDPLPIRAPGMWPDGEPRDAEPPAILVDEPHNRFDLVANILAVAKQVKVEMPDNLRAWLAKELFPLHIKMYSRSKRKAPIYWQLATPSASYSVWLYIHAFTKDTMFHVEELVNDKVLLEERKANELRNDAGESPSAAARKAIAAQDAFLEELRGMAEEVRRVKPLWKPDLDDGVIINFAPLWRLVPQHKAWQKELRETWAALVAGEYDWSHLAMHLWPERVVPKCATDRSFAIAHGLEDIFWLEDGSGKWKPRATPTRPVAELVAERTSAAVTAARDSLINAPTPGGGGGASKRRRAAPKARRPRR